MSADDVFFHPIRAEQQHLSVDISESHAKSVVEGPAAVATNKKSVR
jgi:hypothetical protein